MFWEMSYIYIDNRDKDYYILIFVLNETEFTEFN